MGSGKLCFWRKKFFFKHVLALASSQTWCSQQHGGLEEVLFAMVHHFQGHSWPRHCHPTRFDEPDSQCQVHSTDLTALLSLPWAQSEAISASPKAYYRQMASRHTELIHNCLESFCEWCWVYKLGCKLCEYKCHTLGQ